MFQEKNLKRRKTRESIETVKEDIKGVRKTLNRCENLHKGYRPVVQCLVEKQAEDEKKKMDRRRRIFQVDVETMQEVGNRSIQTAEGVTADGHMGN